MSAVSRDEWVDLVKISIQRGIVRFDVNDEGEHEMRIGSKRFPIEGDSLVNRLQSNDIDSVAEQVFENLQKLGSPSPSDTRTGFSDECDFQLGYMAYINDRFDEVEGYTVVDTTRQPSALQFFLYVDEAVGYAQKIGSDETFIRSCFPNDGFIFIGEDSLNVVPDTAARIDEHGCYFSLEDCYPLFLSFDSKEHGSLGFYRDNQGNFLLFNIRDNG